MHIVSITDRQIKFVPRIAETGSLSLKIIDDQTKNEYISTETATVSGNYISITPSFIFGEGKFYRIIISGTEELYRGKVFCTAQTDNSKYTVNKSEYTSYAKANANEYITI